MAEILDFSAFAPSQRDAKFDSLGPADVVNSGWIPPDQRDATQTTAHEAVMADIPDFMLVGKSVNENVTKVCLWDCWKPALGRDYLGTHQIVGSCVGAGGGNALFSLAAADKIKRGDREKVVIPFWLLPYGISRMLGGLNSRGDGSFGSTFAEAVRKHGHIPADLEGLPAFREDDGIVWGQKVELDWSVGRSIDTKWLDMAKPHLVKSTAQCKSTDDVREAIKNYYSVTIASSWGGKMRCPTAGNPPVLLNSHTTSWAHQMSVHGWWDHPDLGEIFYVMNQWGLAAHGMCPSGAPKGGFWIKKADMAKIVAQRETFAFSQFEGFPAVEEPLDFDAF